MDMERQEIQIKQKVSCGNVYGDLKVYQEVATSPTSPNEVAQHEEAVEANQEEKKEGFWERKAKCC